MGYVGINAFQRLTLQWEKLHPYNAAQIMRLRDRYDAAAISEAWSQTLSTLGLGALHIAGHSYQHSRAARPVTFLTPDADLENFLSVQMNTPFHLDSEGPFRAFALPGRDSHTLGLIYQHWIADSVSIRVLMREWFYHLTGRSTRQQPLPIIQPPRSLPSLFQIRSAIAAFTTWQRSGRSLRRLPPQAMHDLSVCHRLATLPPQTASLLRDAARRHNAKFTDLLLCSIALTAHKHLPPLKTRRPDIAIGNIRDLRQHLNLADPDTFGAALGFATTRCPVTLLANRQLLLQHIAADNARLKVQAPASEGQGIHLAIAAGQLLRPARLLEFYRRRIPVAAGLSNLDLTSTFAGRHPEILSYHRVSPTGPTMPLAITPTTLRDRFDISFTWRNSVFTQTTITAFINDLTADLQHWTQSASQPALYEPAA